MSRRREGWWPHAGRSFDSRPTMAVPLADVEPANQAIASDSTLEDEWSEAFGHALLLGVVLVVLGAGTPFVLLALAWLGVGR